MILAVNEITKKPKLITDMEDIIYIKDKRKNILKSVVIPARYIEMIKDKLDEIEYDLWLKKNEKGLMRDMDSLLDEAIEEIGDKLD